MPVLELPEIVNKLNDRRVNPKHVVKDTGLSYDTVLNIRSQRQTNPNLNTIKKLSEFFAKRDPNE